MSDTIESSLLETDPDCKDIVAKYVSFLPVRLDEIRNAMKLDDVTNFKALIHDLKGVSGGMGYPQVTELCQIIELTIQKTGTSVTGENIYDKISELALLQEKIEAGFKLNT